MKKGKDKKLSPAVLAVLLSLAILLTATLIYTVVRLSGFDGKDSGESTSSAVTQTDKDTAKPDASDSEKDESAKPIVIDVLSVGDNLIHSSIYNQALARGNSESYDFEYAYANIADDIAGSDLATINQETVMSDLTPPSSYPLFNSPRELGEHMIKIGFDVFSLANNHMLDMGEAGLISTIEYWNSKADVVHTGAYLNDKELNTPETKEVNGIKLGFVAATQYTNGLSLPQGSKVRYILTSQEELLKQKIKSTKEVCDFVIVNVHWGDEYATTPNEAQRALAQKMVDWGADIIIGHHPHVLQTMEYLTKPDGSKAVVIYSLGNFISAQDTSGLRMIGGMLNYQIVKDKDTDKTSLGEVKFIPTITHYDSGFKNIRIYKLSDYSEELAAAHGINSFSSFSMGYINDYLTSTIPQEFLEN